MSPRLALHLLGFPKLEIDGSPIITDRRKALALLAYLVLNRGLHTREYLRWSFFERNYLCKSLFAKPILAFEAGLYFRSSVDIK